MPLTDVSAALRGPAGLEASPVRLRLQPTRGWRALDLRELWHYRELAYFLAWRDVKVRYKQTAIGVAWVILQPVAMVTAFTLCFSRLTQPALGTGVPYPVFALAGLWPWQLFSRTLSESTQSLITDQRLVTRVYFPRLLIPLATTLAALVDFAITGVLVAALMAHAGAPFRTALLLMPLLLVLLLVSALGVGFWLSALNVEYRDVMHMVPFLTQLWFFVTPIAYPSALVPERWQAFYALNPMVGVVEAFRWALLGSCTASPATLAISASSACALFVSGLVWFRRRERTFVDALGSGG